MSQVLRVDREKLEFRAVKSHASRVVNLKELLGENFSVEDLISHIERFVLDTMSAEACEPPSAPEIDALCERNASAAWIYSDKRYLTNYTVHRKRKYPFGLVKIEMELQGETIAGIRISGDFFGTSPMEELERWLVGQSVGALEPIDLTPYIAGMSFSEMSALIAE